jgi:predicted nucleic acid-binding protein
LNYLLDSNIIIYSAKPANDFLRDFIAKNSPEISALSYLEVLGYHKLEIGERKYLEKFFNASGLLEISKEILDEAVKLRQKRKMTIADSIIAGTALKHNLTLATRNIRDFKNIKELKLFDPFE